MAMTLDKEFDVAVEAVKLVISILRYHRDMLTDKVCDRVSVSLAESVSVQNFSSSYDTSAQSNLEVKYGLVAFLI